jgi:hypothetical protein
MVIIILLATIMAIFGVIGYLSGTKAALLTTVVILIGLILIARAGPAIARLINGVDFGVRFVLAGGLAALGAPGDRAAAIAHVIESMGTIQPLVAPTNPGPALVLVLLVLVLLSLLIGRHPRLPLRGPSSLGGLLLGLLNGYLLGAYLLVSLFPVDAAFLPLPLGLGPRPSVPVAATPLPTVPASGGSLFNQLINAVQGTSENTLAAIMMVLIAVFVLALAFFGGGRRTGRSRRDGPS